MSRSIRGLSGDLRDQQRFFAKGESEFAKKMKERRRQMDVANRQDLRAMAARRSAAGRARALGERLAERRTVGFQQRQLRQREAERAARQQAIRAEGMEKLTGGMTPAGAMLATVGAVTALTAAVGFLAAKFTGATLAAVSFAQRSKTALSSILKDGTLAAQQFSEVRREAGKLGIDVFDTVDSFKMLANAGFQVPMARDLVRMSADLQALTGSGESAQFALRAISQIKMKGRLQAEEITGQLAEHGVSADEVYKVLGKTLGKTREEILKMQKAGDLSADVAIPAILQAVRNQLGVKQSGGFALQMNMSSIGGMWNTLKSQVQNAFISLGERVEPGITRAFQSIMGSIQKAVASPQMTAFTNAIVGMFDTLSDFAGRIDFATLMTDAATSLGTELVKAATFIRDNGAQIRENFVAFVTAMGTGLKMALDFFKPFLVFASSDFAKFMFTPMDQNTNGIFEKRAKESTPGAVPSNQQGIAMRAGMAGGTKNFDMRFGDMNFNIQGGEPIGPAVAGSITDQVRREMRALLEG